MRTSGQQANSMFHDEERYFNLRKEAKTYISKVFKYDGAERVRNVTMVMEGNDQVLLGEIEGAISLRLTGEKRKTQVTAMVTQDHKKQRRLSLQAFRSSYRSATGYHFTTNDKDEFTFRPGEFERLLTFLKGIEFIDFSNEERFQIEDISTTDGPKAIIDAADRGIVERFRRMSKDQRNDALRAMQGSLTSEEINILLGRRQGLEEFEEQMRLKAWSERQWQDFFYRQQWVFGYGLDYRVMGLFDREMTVGAGGTDNQNKPTVDFLMSFTDYTVLVEIKKPDTAIFRQSRGGRAGTREFSPDFTSAVSQIVEQKAEWSAFAQTGEHHNKTGTAALKARTRNAKSILVIGSREEFSQSGNVRDERVMRDTFELFRREMRSIDIVTFDELLERARFITRK
jgi:hypothetical protein